MNCPFCHNRAEVAGSYKLYCPTCYGQPLWQNYPYGTDPDRLSYINFHLKIHFSPSLTYFPTLHIIEIRHTSEIKVPWFQDVTPDNVEDTFLRIKKLLVFS